MRGKKKKKAARWGDRAKDEAIYPKQRKREMGERA